MINNRDMPAASNNTCVRDWVSIHPKDVCSVDKLARFRVGLTKREHFAVLAMQGLCSTSIAGAHKRPDNLVKEAVQMADALLAALEGKEDE